MPPNSQNHRKSIKGKEVPRSTSFSASFTIEAALLFPLVLFLLMIVLSIFRILQVQRMTEEALAFAGGRVALEAASEEHKEQELYRSVLKYFNSELKKQKLPTKYILGGRLGIRFQDIDIAGEYIDLFIHYRCKFPVNMFGIKSKKIVQRTRIKKWNGFHGDGDKKAEGEWVFVTPTGRVYHKSRECTHLKLSITSVSASTVTGMKYSPCKRCGKNTNKSKIVYITEEGERYHMELGCSGLKRTIYMIEISQAGDKTGCSRCGGK